MRDELAAGQSPREVFDRYGIICDCWTIIATTAYFTATVRQHTTTIVDCPTRPQKDVARLPFAAFTAWPLAPQAFGAHRMTVPRRAEKVKPVAEFGSQSSVTDPSKPLRTANPKRLTAGLRQSGIVLLARFLGGGCGAGDTVGFVDRLGGFGFIVLDFGSRSTFEWALSFSAWPPRAKGSPSAISARLFWAEAQSPNERLFGFADILTIVFLP